MLLLVVLQSVLMPAQRTAERAHFHVAGFQATTAAPASATADADRAPVESSKSVQDLHAVQDGEGEDGHQHGAAHGLARHGQEPISVRNPDHRHAHAAVHGHVDGRADVVYLDALASGSASDPAPPTQRLAFDFDAILPGESILPTAVRHQAPAGDIALNFRSHTVLPLPRPPRHRA